MTLLMPYVGNNHVDVRSARQVCDQTKVDPTSLTASGPSLLKGKLTSAEIEQLADTLVRSSAAMPRAQLEGLLTATVGASIARRLLDRRQVGEAWSRITDLMQTGAVTAELKGDAALGLARELRSDAASAFKQRLEDDPTPTGVRDAIHHRASNLSANAIITLARDVVANKGIAVRHGVEHELQRFAVASELRGIFRQAGDAMELRAMRPGELIRDEVLFLEAFETFVHTNDAALRCLADGTQHALDAITEGDDFTVHANGQSLPALVATLKDEIDRMVRWHGDLYTVIPKTDNSAAFGVNPSLISAAYNRVMAKLDEATYDLQRLFEFQAQGTGYPNFASDLANGLVPAHVAEPYEGFISVCSKSKANVEAATAETVEELIRILHRDVAQMYAEHVRRFASQSLTLRKSHAYADETKSRSLRMTYVGSHSEESLKGTPMGVVRDTIRDYIRSSHSSGYNIDDAVLTDKTLAFDTVLGCHRGRLAVTYDSAHQLYFVEWGMQEPETKPRIVYCKELFEKQGYAHEVEGYKHSASRKITPENIHNELLFLMFTLDNLRNVDVSPFNYTPDGLRKIFEGWLNHRTVKPTVSPDATREEKVAQLAAQDSHVFQIAATNGDYEHLSGMNAVLQFYGEHLDHFSQRDAASIKADLKAIATHYYTELHDSLRAHVGPKMRRADQRLPHREDESIASYAEDIAACDTRDKLTSYFAEHRSRGVYGPMYQSTH